jgi:hypothetical protein
MKEHTKAGLNAPPILRERVLAAAGVDGIELQFANEVHISCVVGSGEPFEWDVWDARPVRQGAWNVGSGLTLEAAIAVAVEQSKKTLDEVRRG